MAQVVRLTKSTDATFFRTVVFIALGIGHKMEVLKPKQRYDFVLVHGAQHGAWCWFKTIELLAQAGHRAMAVDLVSAGSSTVDADDVKSFDHYNQPLYEVLESLIPDQKSMGGTTVARATERYAHKIHATIYVAGTMLFCGMAKSPKIMKMYSEKLREMHSSTSGMANITLQPRAGRL